METEELYKFKAILIRDLKDVIKPLIEALNENTRSRKEIQLQMPIDEMTLPFDEMPKNDPQQKEEVVEETPTIEVDGDQMYIDYAIKRLLDYDKETPIIDQGIITLMTSDRTNHIFTRRNRYIVRLRMCDYEFCGKSFTTYPEAIAFRDRIVKALGSVAYAHRSILNQELMYKNCVYGKSFTNKWLELLHHTDERLEKENEQDC